jgi:hypothetical protein
MAGFLFGPAGVQSYKRQPTSLPLTGPPPCLLPCEPTLLLGLMPDTAKELDDVYRIDLVYSRTSQLKEKLANWAGTAEVDHFVLLRILQFLDGESLMKICSIFQGTVMVDGDALYDDDGDLVEEQIEALKERLFQAIVVPDYCLSPESTLRDFVVEQYNSGVNVVVMAIEGLFSLSYMRQFGVTWRMTEYTKKSIILTEAGMRLLGKPAFPFESKYTKSHFVAGDGVELFAEVVEEEEDDEDVEEDDEEESEEEAPRAPQPGSPVITHIEENRCISFFGFVNSLDVSWGAIIHRLCFAAQYNTNSSD